MLQAGALAAARAIVCTDEELMSSTTLCGHQSPLQLTGCPQEKSTIGLAAASLVLGVFSERVSKLRQTQ